MLTLVARIKIKESAVSRFVEAIPALTAATLAEAGCSQYEFNQAHDDPSLFLVYEKWADQAALDEHMQAPHMQAFVADFGSEFAEPPTMQFLTTIA